MNTGAALWRVHDDIIGSDWDRDDARDCVVVITDENSSDDVSAPALALRKADVMVRNRVSSRKSGREIPRFPEIYVEIPGNIFIH